MAIHAASPIRRTALFAMLLWLTAGSGFAQSSLDSQQLGARDYALRQRATRQLWSERPTSRDEVERAARDPDPEVAARARWILQRWQQGLLPDTPPDVLRQLAGSEGIERLEGLLDAGLFQAVTVAVEQASGAATGPQLRSEVSESLERRFAFYVRTAVESNQLDAFCDLLEVATESPALAVARADLLTRLGFDLRQRGVLPTSAQRWSEVQRTRTTVLVRATLGELDEALQSARESNQEDMARACHLLLGNWDALIGESQLAAEAATPGSLEAYRHWSDVLIAARRAEQPSLADFAAEQLAGPDGVVTDPLATELRWRCLLIHGYIDPALEILQPSNPVDTAEVLSYLGRFGEAFQVLGIDPVDPEVGLRLLFEQVRQELLTPNAGLPQTPSSESALQRLSMAGKLLLRAGEDVRAHRLFRELTNLDDASSGEQRARHEAVITLWSLGHHEAAIELVAAEGQTAVTPTILYDLIRRMAVFDNEQAKALAAVWEAMQLLDPQQPASERFQILVQLYQGETPWKSDIDSHFQRLFEQLQGDKTTVQRVNGRLVVAGRGYANAALGDFFSRLGQTEYARQIYDQLAASEDSTADLRLAELELSSGSASKALTIYRRVWERHSGFRQQRHLVNTADADLLAALKAVIGEAIACERTGDDLQAAQSRRMLQLMLCGSSGTVRKDFCEHLAEIGEKQLALETLERLVRYTAFGADETLDFGRIALAYGSLLQEEAPSEAARWHDLALSGTLESESYYARGYLVLPAQHQALHAIAAAERQDRPAVAKHLENTLRLFPMNIPLVEEVLEKLRERGMETEANDALTKVFEVGLRHLQSFPNDAEDANNLAWLAALGDQRLDQALELAQRACFLEPDSVSYRDTLAEVLYRQGRVEEALTIERHCLLDEPSLWHLHEQIARFEAGK